MRAPVAGVHPLAGYLRPHEHLRAGGRGHHDPPDGFQGRLDRFDFLHDEQPGLG